jgi:RNA-binding protein YlmH
MDETITITLHTALSHLNKRNTYVRMLFIDYSSTFNTLVTSKLITKLRALGLNPVQLGDGLPDRPNPSGEVSQQHVLHSNPQ